MRQLTTQVHSAEPGSSTVNLARQAREAMQKAVDRTRQNSSPTIGVISNFDPDQRGFVTDALKGYAMLQKQAGASVVGALAVSGDYGQLAPIPGQLNSTANPMRVTPGLPQVIYPVGNGLGAANLAYIRGGQIDYKRAYPAKLLTRNERTFAFGGDGTRISQNVFGTTNAVVNYKPPTLPDFLAGIDVGHLTWNENSPLPPGMRYIEMEDIIAARMTPLAAGQNIGSRLASLGVSLDTYRMITLQNPGDTYFTDFNSYLPHDSRGNIRKNRVPFPYNSFYYLDELKTDDTYWGGDCDDPLNWHDDYWDGLDRDPTGNTPRIDRAAMKDWLAAHPKARYTS